MNTLVYGVRTKVIVLGDCIDVCTSLFQNIKANYRKTNAIFAIWKQTFICCTKLYENENSTKKLNP